MSLLIITKNYPPAICGVGDHTARLVREFEKKGIGCIVFTETSDAAGEGVIVSEKSFDASMAAQLLRLIGQHGISQILWQYVPYSYDKKGLPFWWPGVIRKIGKTGVQQAVFFHEVSLRVWGYGSRQFAAAICQRIIANLAARSARSIFTSIPLYAGYFWFKKPVIVPISANIMVNSEWSVVSGEVNGEGSVPARIHDSGGGVSDEVSSECLPDTATAEAGSIVSDPKPATLSSEAFAKGAGNFILRSFSEGAPQLVSIFCFANRADKALLEAFARLKKDHDIQLILGGFIGDERKLQLEGWIQEAGLGAFIRVTGAIDNVALAGLINEAIIYIQPQIVERGNQGGISAKNGTVMAAMSMGKAIITCKGDMTDPAIFEEDKNIVFVPYGNAPAYRQAIQSLLQNPGQAEQLGIAALKTYRQRCSWQQTAGKIADTLTGSSL